ncbi:MAG: helical backbone metal receptor [Oscillospiraceae bacterium]
MKKYLYILALAAMLIFTACAQINEEEVPEETAAVVEEVSPYPVTVGSLVFNSSPETAASISPAITEIIAELGITDKLIGRSVYCVYPDEIKSLDALGSAANPDIEAIKNKAPQLLLSQSPIAKKDISSIEESGTRVLIIPAPSSAEELKELYRNIYRVFYGENEEMSAITDSAFEPLETSFEEKQGFLKSFVYIISPELGVASVNTFQGEFFSHYGENLAGESDTLTAEDIIKLDPDYIILPPDITADMLPEELAEMSDRVISLSEESEELLERPTSRVYLAAEQLYTDIGDKK